VVYDLNKSALMKHFFALFYFKNLISIVKKVKAKPLRKKRNANSYILGKGCVLNTKPIRQRHMG